MGQIGSHHIARSPVERAALPLARPGGVLGSLWLAGWAVVERAASGCGAAVCGLAGLRGGGDGRLTLLLREWAVVGLLLFDHGQKIRRLEML